MDPKLAGLLVALGILVFLAGLLLHKLLLEGQDRRRFARYFWTVYRTGSYVENGTSYRCEDPSQLDRTAAEILTEWFETESGEKALLYDGQRVRYHCVVTLEGYGVGEAWGR